MSATGSVAWIGDERPCDSASVVGVAERVGKSLSEGRVEGAGRATSCVMGEGLQSELVMGESVVGDKEEGPGGASEACCCERDFGCGAERCGELTKVRGLLGVKMLVCATVEWWSGVYCRWEERSTLEETRDEPNE